MTQHLINIGFSGVQAFAFNSQDRVGNALFSMSWTALAIPFTLIAQFASSKLFVPTEQNKNFPSCAKKVSTMDDFGDVALKTTISIASIAPILFLSKQITSQAGFGQIKPVQQPLVNDVACQIALILSGALVTHLLGCLFESVELASKA